MNKKHVYNLIDRLENLDKERKALRKEIFKAIRVVPTEKSVPADLSKSYNKIRHAWYASDLVDGRIVDLKPLYK